MAIRHAIFAGLLPAVLALPGAVPAAEPTGFVAAVAPRGPEPTAVNALAERGLVDDVASYVSGLESKVASKFNSVVNSGLLDFHGLPTGSQVSSSLGISDSDLAAQPTQVLNLPAYGNWTNDGWSVRARGNVYKLPQIDQKRVDDLANVFLIDTSVDKLDDAGKAQARNLTRSIFVVQQGNQEVTMDFVADGQNGSQPQTGPIKATGGSQKIKLPYNTTAEGDFDVFVTLKNETGSNGGHLLRGDATSRIQTLEMYAEGVNNSGNATAYLVPPQGITIISDIDDILRITKIYEPKEGLLNTFARPFVPWMNMPDIYANWSESLTDIHFHYLTTTPEQATRNYMEFIYKTYPLGSFDTRPLNFSDLSATLSIRKFLLDRVFQTFPSRKFILVADTTNSDVMKAYPELYHEHPDQVQCIFLRNTSATDDGNKFPYNTEGFKGIPEDRFMFFKVPDDLTKLDIAKGHCLNRTIPQNVTFSYQGLPFGLGNKKNAASMPAVPKGLLFAWLGVLVWPLFL